MPDGVEVDGLGELESDLEDAANVDDSVAYAGTALDYGYFLEFGTVKMEARPWLRPASRRAGSLLRSIITGMLEDWDMDGVSNLAEHMADQAVIIAKRSMRRHAPPAPPGEAPAVRTSMLLNSVVWEESEPEMIRESKNQAQRVSGGE